MNKKEFLILLIMASVIGGSIGGAFAGGMALGRLQDTPDFGQGEFRSRDMGREGPGVMRADGRGPRDNWDGPERAGARGPGGPPKPEGMGPKNIINGTISTVEDSQITVTWGANQSQIEVGEDATIYSMGQVAMKDIVEGDQVTIGVDRNSGRRGELDAFLVTVNPPEDAGLPPPPPGPDRGRMTGHITGTVGKSSDDHLMVMSGSGRTKVNIGDDVTVQGYHEGSLTDLAVGDRVLIIASIPDERRKQKATTSILVNPPGHNPWKERP